MRRPNKVFAKVTPGLDTPILCEGLGNLEKRVSHGTSVGLIDADDAGVIILLPSLSHSGMALSSLFPQGTE